MKTIKKGITMDSLFSGTFVKVVGTDDGEVLFTVNDTTIKIDAEKADDVFAEIGAFIDALRLAEKSSD